MGTRSDLVLSGTPLASFPPHLNHHRHQTHEPSLVTPGLSLFTFGLGLIVLRHLGKG
jgi:hypothetical protein